MNILITGGNGYVARELNKLFQADGQHVIYTPNRHELNCLNRNDVCNYIYKNKIDVVLHTAIKGGRRFDNIGSEEFYQNLLMFQNIKASENLVDIIINFGSGYEFDNRTSIIGAHETEIFECVPIDFYGLSKNIIAQQIANESIAFCNLRIFNVYNENEESERFITTCIRKALANETFEIFSNKKYDFIHMNDLYQIILQTIPLETKYRDFNCIYSVHESMFDIAKYIYSKTNSSGKVVIQDNEILHYYGDHTRLYKEYDTSNFLGLYGGIDLTIDKIKG